tara:strand:- start:75352 stop:92235 length:16884 start_codon:yes stop_codon:yes gene_type:complete
VSAELLLARRGQLIALNGSVQKAAVIDLHDYQSPGVIANWPLALSAGITHAEQFAGKVYLDSAQVLEFTPGSDGYLPVFVAAESGSVSGLARDVSVARGSVIAAQDNYGAVIHQRQGGGWTSDVHPQPAYSSTVTRVASDANYHYLLHSGQQKVERITHAGSGSNFFYSGNALSDLSVFDRWLALADGSSVQLFDRDTLSLLTNFSVGNGESIVALAGQGHRLAVSTDSGTIYTLVARPNVDVTQWALEEEVSALPESVRRLAVTQDYLIYGLDARVIKRGFYTQTETQIDVANAQFITALTVHNGQIWVAYQDNDGAALAAYDLYTNDLLPAAALRLDAAATAMSGEWNRLILAQGSRGVQILEIPLALESGDISAVLPTPATAVAYGETLQNQFADVESLNSVEWYINNQLVVRAAQKPFASQLPVPASLPNGQSFTLYNRVELTNGRVLQSVPRALFLQSESQLVNDFQVSMDVIEHSWGPKPFDVKAVISGSSQAIAQVELFVASSVDGPWELVGKLYGPEYKLAMNWGVERSGHFVKARAVDIYGNVAESQPQRFYRYEDTTNPSAAFTLSGDSVDADGQTVVQGFPYQLSVAINDSESGIDKALLRRNGVLVAAAFENGVLTFSDQAADTGVIQYQIEVVDNALNSISQAFNVTIGSNQGPVIDNLNYPAQVRELDSFTVSVSASDDVRIDRLEVVWGGTVYGRDINQASATAEAFTIVDQRVERLTADATEALTVRVTDNSGILTQVNYDVSVLRDRAPVVANLNVTPDARGFYGGSAGITLSNLQNVDDASGLNVEIVQVNAGVETTVFERTNLSGYTNTLNHYFRYPTSALDGDMYRFKVVLKDKIGQEVETALYEVPLTQAPNLIRFAAVAANENPLEVQVGESPVYRVEVLDAAARPVAGQQVRWTLKDVASSNVISMGDSTSAENGTATLNMSTSLRATSYELRAELVDYPVIERAQFSVTVKPGQTQELRFNQMPEATAGELFSINVDAYDAQGNRNESDSATSFTLTMPNPDFEVTAGDNVNIQTITTAQGSVQRAVVTLQNGAASLQVRATTVAGDYQLAITGSSGKQTRYDHDGSAATAPQSVSELPLVVAAADAVTLLFVDETLAEQAEGDVAEYGTKRAARIYLVMEDTYGNRSQRFLGEDANFTLGVAVSGSAVINDQGNLVDVALVDGVATLDVSNTEYETVTLTVASVPAQYQVLDYTTTFDLLFNQQPPEINESGFLGEVNSTRLTAYFVYDETVEALQAGTLVSILSAGVEINGTSSIQGDTVFFTPDSALALNTCYQYDTTGSVLTSATRAESVRVEQGDVCTPQALVGVPNKLAVYIGQSVTLPVQLGVSYSSISSGQVTLGDSTLGFSWNPSYRRFTVPDFAALDPGFSDGVAKPLTLSGTYGGAALTVGNSLTLQVYLPDGDADGDGIPNRIEIETGNLLPGSIDSDGNGTLDINEDSDGDGLSNGAELAAGTLINDSDTDNDGLSDGSEVLNHGSNPLLQDSDGDGLTDYVEVSSIPSSDPTLRDTDGDGMNDAQERQNNLNPRDADDAAADEDGDGLSNLQEIQLGTLVRVTDTDGDTLSDGDEVNTVDSDPLLQDTDDDGLRDDEDSEPRVPDTQSPQITLSSPAAGEQLLKGQTITLTPALSDNGRVVKVDYYINNATLLASEAAPFSVSYQLPALSGELQVRAIAYDTNDNAGEINATFTVIDDPLTTVIGRVVDGSGAGLPDVTVTVLGLETITQSDGAFVVTQVPVAGGAIQVVANGVVSGDAVTALSDTYEPVWAGTTDVGDILLQPVARKVGYYSHRDYQGSSNQASIITNAGFDAVQIVDPVTEDLSELVMVVVESDQYYRSWSGGASAARKAAFEAYAENGGILVWHEDRPYDSNTTYYRLPGLDFWPIYNTDYSNRYPVYDINLMSDIMVGAAGDLNRNSLGNTNGSYGYLPMDQLPEGMTPVMLRSDRRYKQVAAVEYEYGSGLIYYSTVRMAYLVASSPYNTVYMPNLLQSLYNRSLADQDEDGLPDIQEYSNGTDPYSNDKDGDGLLDGFEVRFGYDPTVDEGVANLDDDNDGLTTLEEQAIGTHPKRWDTDGDGLYDGEEVNPSGAYPASSPLSEDTDFDGIWDDDERTFGGDPNLSDTDADGLSDYVERYNSYTSLTNPDSDFDGLSDGIEYNSPILNPNNDQDANADYDNDGLNNKLELLVYETDPEVADTDSDGLLDGAEILAGADPYNPDSDGDGMEDGVDNDPLEFDTVAPQVVISSPAAGYEVVYGEELSLSVDLTENGVNESVTYTIDGTNTLVSTDAPFSVNYTAPVSGDSFTLEVYATDVSGNTSTVVSETYSLIADLPMTVTGRVLDALGQPVEAVSVEVGGITVTTDSEGTFTVTGVPTIDTLIRVSASTQFGAAEMTAESVWFEPVRNGNVSVGDLVLSTSGGTNQGTLVGYYNMSSNSGVSSQLPPITAAGLQGASITDLNNDNLTEYTILFVELPSNSSNSYSSTYINNSAKIAQFVDDGGVLIVHDRSTGNSNRVLPGNPGTAYRDVDSNVSLAPDAPADFVSGPGGTITNSTLDGSSASHGYVLGNTVEPGSYPLIVQADNGQWVTYVYPYGRGKVVYSSTPLDYFLVNYRSGISDIYPANLLSYVSRNLTKIDSDGDGVADADEVPLGLDPFNEDSDGDSLIDGWEIEHGFNPLSEAGAGETFDDPDTDGLNNLEEQTWLTDPNNPDSDGDTLVDGDEVNIHGTDPAKSDTDGDELSDDYELAQGLLPDNVDSDGDTLNDYDEIYVYDTNPLATDSDGDEIPDLYEVENGLLNEPADGDLDNDGLTNLEEFQQGTNPQDQDSDDDQLWDGWELGVYQTDPTLPDSDNDGRWDGNEAIVDGTDPNDPASVLPVTSMCRTLNDANGRSWQFCSEGAVTNSWAGSSGSTSSAIWYDGFDASIISESGSTSYYGGNSTVGTSQEGREWHFAAQELNDLLYARRVFVPASGEAFVRYIEILENPTDVARTITVSLYSRYGRYSNYAELQTSSGDNSIDVTDSYALWRDTNYSSRPVIGHLFKDDNVATSITDNSYGASGNYNWDIEFEVTIPANSRRALMHFATMESDFETGEPNLQNLQKMSATTLAGIDAELAADIVNFNAFIDSDEDGLSDELEATFGSDPQLSDTDGDGLSDLQEYNLGTDPQVPDNTVPVVTWVNPVEGDDVYRGADLQLAFDVVDDGSIEYVELYVDDVLYTTIADENYSVAWQVPDADSVTLKVIAYDSNANQGQSEIVIAPQDVPSTDLTGAVRFQGVAGDYYLAGLTVDIESSGSVTTTDENGQFTLTNISAMSGELVVSVSGVVGAVNLEEEFVLESSGFNYGGVTDIGTLDLGANSISVEFNTDAGENYYFNDEGTGQYALAKDFSFFGQSYSNIYVDSNGYVRFVNYGRTSYSVPWMNPPLVVPFGMDMDGRGNPLTVAEDDNGAYVTWYNYGHWSRGGAATFQLQLLGGGVFAYLYQSADQVILNASSIYIGLSPGSAADTYESISFDTLIDSYTTPDNTEVRSSIPSSEFDAIGKTIVFIPQSDGQYNVVFGAIGQNISIGMLDSDGDGLTDLEETLLGVTAVDNPDYDDDGLLDGDEYSIGTDPINSDSDGDDLLDGFEVTYGFDPNSPVLPGERDEDFDNDGLTNFEEQQLGTDPTLMDTDGDMLSDGLEVNELGSDPTSTNSDSDSLADWEEFIYGSSLVDADTDGDGLDDYAEVYIYGTSPTLVDTDGDQMSDRFEADWNLFNAVADADYDGDGLLNYEEELYGTDPTRTDTDYDELTDGEEVNRYNTNPAEADSDVDGRWDQDELFVDNTDPNLASSVLTDSYLPYYSSLQQGIQWTIHRDGYISDIRVDTISITTLAGRLNVTGDVSQMYYNDGSNGGDAATDASGYEHFVGPDRMQDLMVSRRVYRDSANHDYVRYLDLFANVGDAAVSINATYNTNYLAGAGGSGAIELITESGQAQPTESDRYIILYDSVDANQPVLGHIMLGLESVAGNCGSTAQAQSNYWDQCYSLTVAAGDQVALLHYYVVGRTVAEVQARIDAILRFDSASLYNMDAALIDDVANFDIELDSDSDGLSDALEQILGTNINLADTDGDGMSDAFEYANELEPVATDDSASDKDGDGLTNIEEMTLGTSVTNPDTDGDGVSDGDEVNVYNGNPFLTDTDGDGLQDGDEVTYNTKLDDVDSDDDGLNDYLETAIGFDPNATDGDGDGIPDEYERAYFNGDVAPDADYDNDGLSNLYEYQNNLLPNDADTDNDLLLDGEELTLGTDPLLFASDTLLRGDAEERFVDGTDPLESSDDLTTLSLPGLFVDGAGGEWAFDTSGNLTLADSTYNAIRSASMRPSSIYYGNYSSGYYTSSSDLVALGDDGEFATSLRRYGDALYHRRVYVPTTGDSFVRYQETFDNQSDAAMDVGVRLSSYYHYYSSSSEVTLLTSSGDSVLNEEDYYLIAYSPGSPERPVLGHLFGTQYSAVKPCDSSAAGTNYWYLCLESSVAPGERVTFLHYVVMGDSVEDVQAQLDALRKLDGQALNGIDANQAATIANLSAYVDSDGDGLSDVLEASLGTLNDSQDSDGDGVSDWEEYAAGGDPAVADNADPTVVLLTPSQGEALYPYEAVTLSAQAEDDSKVAEVNFWVDGELVGSVSESPYELQFYLPYGTFMDVEAIATDATGRTGSSGVVRFDLQADSSTTVSSRVLLDYNGETFPMAGLTVTDPNTGSTAITDELGEFSLANVSARDNALLRISGELAGETLDFTTMVDSSQMIVGGETLLADVIYVRNIKPYYENQLSYEDTVYIYSPAFQQFALDGAVTWGEQTYTQAYISNYGDVVFGDLAPVDGENPQTDSYPMVSLFNSSNEVGDYMAYKRLADRHLFVSNQYRVLAGEVGYYDFNGLLTVTDEGVIQITWYGYPVGEPLAENNTLDIGWGNAGDTVRSVPLTDLYNGLTLAQGESLSAAINMSPYLLRDTFVTMTPQGNGTYFVLLQNYDSNYRDTDYDDLPDLYEFVSGYSDYQLRDTDGDGVYDGDEYALGLEADNVDSDGDQLRDNVDNEPAVADTELPVLGAIWPNDGDALMPDRTVYLSAEVTDNEQVAEVRFLVDGVATVASPLGDQYGVSITTPTTGAFTVQVEATDVSGNTAQSAVRTVTIIDNGLTSLEGRVLYRSDAGEADLGGVTIAFDGYGTVVTDVDGGFRFDNVMLEGSQELTITGQVGNQAINEVWPLDQISVISDLTTMQDIIIEPQTFAPGYNWSFANSDSFQNERGTTLTLGHTFNYYGVDYTTIYISDNGYITFGSELRQTPNPGSLDVDMISVLGTDFVYGYRLEYDTNTERTVIHWRETRIPGYSTYDYAQLVLYADGRIYMHYYDVDYRTAQYKQPYIGLKSTASLTSARQAIEALQAPVNFGSATDIRLSLADGLYNRYVGFVPQANGSYTLYSGGLGGYGHQWGMTDTDFDGVSDLDEILIYQTDWQTADGDSDGLLDGEELMKQTDPVAADTTVPNVYLLSPIQDLTLYAGQTITLRADAQDDGRIERLWYVVDTPDGTPQILESTELDSVRYVVPDAASVDIEVHAEDTAGNQSQTATYTFTIKSAPQNVDNQQPPPPPAPT